MSFHLIFKAKSYLYINTRRAILSRDRTPNNSTEFMILVSFETFKFKGLFTVACNEASLTQIANYKNFTCQKSLKWFFPGIESWTIQVIFIIVEPLESLKGVDVFGLQLGLEPIHLFSNIFCAKLQYVFLAKKV